MDERGQRVAAILFRKGRKKKVSSGRRKPLSFEPLIVGRIAERQRNDIINEQIKEFEIILESFIGNRS